MYFDLEVAIKNVSQTNVNVIFKDNSVADLFRTVGVYLNFRVFAYDYVKCDTIATLSHTLNGTTSPYTHALTSPFTLDSDTVVATYLTRMYGRFGSGANEYYKFKPSVAVSVGSTSIVLTIESATSSILGR